jgi:hypothetical protein
MEPAGISSHQENRPEAAFLDARVPAAGTACAAER